MRPLRTRFRYACPFRVEQAPDKNSLAHDAKGTPAASPRFPARPLSKEGRKGNALDRLVRLPFQCCGTPCQGLWFHRSFTVLFTIRVGRFSAVEEGAPLFGPWSRALLSRTGRRGFGTGRSPSVGPRSRGFPESFVPPPRAFVPHPLGRGDGKPPIRGAPHPHTEMEECSGDANRRVRSPLLTASRLMPIPPVLRCFSSRGILCFGCFHLGRRSSSMRPPGLEVSFRCCHRPILPTVGIPGRRSSFRTFQG